MKELGAVAKAPALLAFLVGVACSGGSDRSVTPTLGTALPSSTASQSSAGGVTPARPPEIPPPPPALATIPLPRAVRLHPTGKLTGLEPVDRVLKLIYLRDFSRLADEAVLTPVPCRGQQLACPPGAAQGTTVGVFLLGGCGLSYSTSLEPARQRLASMGADPWFVFSVARPAFVDDWKPAFEVRLATTEARPTQVTTTFYLNEAGRLIGLSGCSLPSKWDAGWQPILEPVEWP
jgi:hypothetical protein